MSVQLLQLPTLRGFFIFNDGIGRRRKKRKEKDDNDLRFVLVYKKNFFHFLFLPLHQLWEKKRERAGSLCAIKKAQQIIFHSWCFFKDFFFNTWKMNFPKLKKEEKKRYSVIHARSIIWFPSWYYKLRFCCVYKHLHALCFRLCIRITPR